MSFYRFTVYTAKNSFIEMPPQAALVGKAHDLGFTQVEDIKMYPIYFVKGELSKQDKKILGNFLFCDELFEYCDTALPKVQDDVFHVETSLKAGVTDSAAREAIRAVKELGITGVEEITSGTAYDISGKISLPSLHILIEKLLYNSVIQNYKIGFIEPSWTSSNIPDLTVETFDVANMNDDELMNLSNSRRAALNLKEMQAIREYFKKENRACTDAEFETIAQTWSEHCVHKTFKAKITVDKKKVSKEQAKNYPNLCVDSVIKTYIKKATDTINAKWVLSAFSDNAGIIDFDEKYEISFKAETHNHPSAVEPFGGANTGVGGVIRDVMGVSARPFAVTDVLCFGMPCTKNEEVPEGSLHPKRIMEGVITGVQDYGNKMGIPTVNGGIHYHKAYGTNPLVYCGCAGIAPKGKHKTKPAAGDHIVSLGGKTGRDGLRGATFSSMIMDAASGDIAGSSVQIGEPIIQKKVAEVLIEARDKGLYSAITDCGAGGYSSAVGEMAQYLGCDADLSVVPVKYAGLTPWEIWLSEAQERMVIAVPVENLEQMKEICRAVDVEFTDLGVFTGDKILKVRFGEKTVINLHCSFLHSGPPQLELTAAPLKKGSNCVGEVEYPSYKAPDYETALNALLKHHAICSKEDTVRLYDHEVQGGTILKPYEGKSGSVPQDAAVIKPMETEGKKAAALSNSLNPRQSILDPYRAAAASIDEAVRNAVAAGADPSHTAILDNFCLGDPKRPETVWALLEMCRACFDTASAFGTPFISGKDSFNNEYLTSDGKREAIPPSLLISAIGIVPDIGKVPGSNFKQKGSFVYLLGKPQFAFGGSVFAEIFGIPAGESSEVPPFNPSSVQLYKHLHKAILTGTVSACHDLSEGGLSVALAEMALDGDIKVILDDNLENLILCSKTALFFGETCGCLIAEVPAEKKDEFEQIMYPCDIYKIGKTISAI